MNPVDTAYNFFVHPFAPEHSKLVTVASVVTIIALSILTNGWYAIILTAIHLFEYCKPELVEAFDSCSNWVQGVAQNAAEVVHNALPAVGAGGGPGREEAHLASIKAERARQSRNAFVGIPALKEIHSAQLAVFEKWAQAGNWDCFHASNPNPFSHYDWWMFPMDNNSRGQGARYQVQLQERTALSEDVEFMRNYRRGVQLVLASLGWDVDLRRPIENPTNAQNYRGYTIRLIKMKRSLQLFGQGGYLQSLNEFSRQGRFNIPDWR